MFGRTGYVVGNGVFVSLFLSVLFVIVVISFVLFSFLFSLCLLYLNAGQIYLECPDRFAAKLLYGAKNVAKN